MDENDLTPVCFPGFRSLFFWFQTYVFLISDLCFSGFRPMFYWFQTYVFLVSDLCFSGFQTYVFLVSDLCEWPEDPRPGVRHSGPHGHCQTGQWYPSVNCCGSPARSWAGSWQRYYILIRPLLSRCMITLVIWRPTFYSQETI